jgi:hypothetical protein
MKKFLICLLVVAIALLGFTGCPSPTTEDDVASGPVDSVDEDVPALDVLRSLTHSALGGITGTTYGDLTPDRVATIFAIVDDIENAPYGWRTQDTYPITARAADSYENYEYYDEENEVRGFVLKATNYPVYLAKYVENIQNWSRYLPDGDLAPGDTLDRTNIQHYSWEWDNLILKTGETQGILVTLQDDIARLKAQGSPGNSTLFGTYATGTGSVFSTFKRLDTSPYYDNTTDGEVLDLVIDGKAVRFVDETYTNTYTKISERIGNQRESHLDTYFTREYDDYSYVFKRAYSIDTGRDYDWSTAGAPGTNLLANSPGAFKIKYELTVTPPETALELMVEDDLQPVYPVNPPAELTRTATDLGKPMGFVIDLQILGRRNTYTSSVHGVGTAEDDLLTLHLETWQDLINASRRLSFARKTTGAATSVAVSDADAVVDTTLIDWILKDVPVLPGAPVEKRDTIIGRREKDRNVQYNNYASLPLAVQEEIALVANKTAK